jgi:uncharacterized protein YdeI (YjbR/CyaY-like superfamily)
MSLAPPTAFASAAAFRTWLAKHHASEPELIVRVFKTSASHLGLGYRDAVDEALCYGWIDGVRRSLDADSFTVRFSPRKPRSKWSVVNVRRVGELEAAGRMRKPGLAAFRARDENDSRRYSFESKPVALDPALEKKLRTNGHAWKYFQEQAPWYRRTSAFWVMSAKREETRERRLGILLDCCARGMRIPVLAVTTKRSSE